MQILDEEMSGVEMDQMTISSPIPQEVPSLEYSFVEKVEQSPARNIENQRALKKVINFDIKKGLRTLTQSIQEQNNQNE